MSIDNLIDSLKNLDLSTYPNKEIRSLLEQIGKISTLELYFHKGRQVMRARPNENEEIRYRKKSELSYKHNLIRLIREQVLHIEQCFMLLVFQKILMTMKYKV